MIVKYSVNTGMIAMNRENLSLEKACEYMLVLIKEYPSYAHMFRLIEHSSTVYSDDELYKFLAKSGHVNEEEMMEFLL